MLGQTIISGIAVGALYGLLALGIVLIYRATEVANFAHGEMSMVSAFVAYILITSVGFNLVLAILGALVFSALLGLGVERVVIRPLAGAAHWSIVFATFGLNLALNGIGVALWARNQPYLFPPPFPRVAIHLGTATVSSLHIGVIGIVLALVAMFLIFFQYTKLGLAMRATAQDKMASELMGISVKSIRIQAWASGSAMGALAGILFAPIVFLETTMMIPFLMKSFCAAIMGGLSSVIGALVGAIFLGVIESLVGSYVYPEGRDAVALVILVVVLLLKPAGLFGVARKKRV